MSYLFLYLAAINIIAFAAMGIDKAKARLRQMARGGHALRPRRSAGRSAARWACVFHHKTKHKEFASAFPRCCACSARPWCILFLIWKQVL